jgi:hypothetical protein
MRIFYLSALPIDTGEPKIPTMTLPDDTSALHVLLTDLKIEHHDLDESIARLEQTPPDELTLRRLKKRKLQIKDRVAAIERMLGPDLIA